MKLKYLFSFVATSMLFMACTSAPIFPKNFDYGIITDTTYSNKFFNIQLSLPRQALLLSSREMKLVINEVSDDVTFEGDSVKQATLKNAAIKTAYLFGVFRVSLPNAGNFDANILALAENVGLSKEIKNAKDYLLDLCSILRLSSTVYSFNEEHISTKTINGFDFAKLSVTLGRSGEITQEYYVSLINEFALCLIYTYADNEDPQILEQIIQSIKPLE